MMGSGVVHEGDYLTILSLHLHYATSFWHVDIQPIPTLTSNPSDSGSDLADTDMKPLPRDSALPLSKASHDECVGVTEAMHSMLESGPSA